MENAADALKMAIAMFIFVIALSIVFFLVSQVKETSDTVLYYSDKTNYYNWQYSDTSNGRIVGPETVIAALYNTGKDSTNIKILDTDRTTEIFPSPTGEKIEDIIKNELKEECQYEERIVEVTATGKYSVGEDGTKLTVIPGDTRVYIYYTKIKN